MPTVDRRTLPDGRRVYLHPETEAPYLGVTSVIGQAWPSAQLERWRVGNIAAQLVGNAKDSASKLERLASKPAGLQELAARKWQERLWGWREDYSHAERGTRIHALLEAMLTNPKASFSGVDPVELEAAKRARKAIKRAGLIVHQVEVSVFGAADGQRYAGTADILAVDQAGRWTVVDLKTGRRVSRTWLPQLAAYAWASEMSTGDGMSAMPAVSRALVLHVPRRAGTVHWWEIDIAQGFDIFSACCRISRAAAGRGGIKEVRL